eukprot:403340817
MMTTAGYGDLAPITVMGRLTCILACLCGVATISLFIVSINQLSRLDQNDEEVYNCIVIANDESKLNELAGKLIKSFFLFNIKRKREKKQGLVIKEKCVNFFDMIKYAHFFYYERRIIQKQGPATEQLLQFMEYEIMASELEINLHLQLFDVNEIIRYELNQAFIQ